MWICLNNAFLSVVHKECKADELLVRARRPGDIERVFPQAEVFEKRGSDYQFRAVLPRAEVAKAIAASVEAIDYGNFKGSVRDHRLHDAYARVWGVMAKLQPVPPYATTDRLL
jgi:hypothetical protein